MLLWRDAFLTAACGLTCPLVHHYFRSRRELAARIYHEIFFLIRGGFFGTRLLFNGYLKEK